MKIDLRKYSEMSNEMKIKGFWLVGWWEMALDWQSGAGTGKQPGFRRDHPRIGYCTGLRNIKTGGRAGPGSAQDEGTGPGKWRQNKNPLEKKPRDRWTVVTPYLGFKGQPRPEKRKKWPSVQTLMMCSRASTYISQLFFINLTGNN